MMFKKYFPFFKATIMNVFIYRGSIIVWILVDVFKFVMLIFLWQAVYTGQDSIGGFTLNDMIIYFLISSVTSIFASSEAHYSLAEEIREGRLSLYLTKPISYKRRLLFENFGRVFGISIILVPMAILLLIVTATALHIDINAGVLQIITFFAYLPLITLLTFEVAFFVGTMMIYTENDFGLSILMAVTMTALSGQLIPLALYPAALQKIINYLPFKYISYPPLILLGKLTDAQIYWGLLSLAAWSIGLNLFNRLVFRVSLKKMVVFGG